jgi:hypothetical protein
VQPVLTAGEATWALKEATWALKEFAIPTAVSCIMSLLPDLPGGGRPDRRGGRIGVQ